MNNQVTVNMANIFVNKRKRLNFVLIISILAGLLLSVLLNDKETGSILGFSLWLILMTIVCFSWWYNPTHPYPFYYFSPHTFMLIFSYLWLCLGNLPVIIIGKDEIFWLDPGADRYYLPIAWLVLLATFLFDVGYRFFTKVLNLNGKIIPRITNFLSDNKDIGIYGVSWYIASLLNSIFMAKNFQMQTFGFIGSEKNDLTNILAKSLPYAIVAAWTYLSLFLFVTKKWKVKIIVVCMFLFVSPILFAYQSRTLMVSCLGCSLIAYLLVRKKAISRKVVFLIIGVSIALILFITSIKLVVATDVNYNKLDPEIKQDIYRRTKQIISSDKLFDLDGLFKSLNIHFQSRFTGIDWPAYIMLRHYEDGLPLLNGAFTIQGMLSAVPRIVWPSKYKFTAQLEGYSDLNDLNYDQGCTIFSSLYIDWGASGVLLGYLLLSWMLCFIQAMIFNYRKGMLVYLGTLWGLFLWEATLFTYPFYWGRWAIVVAILNTFILFSYRIIKSGARGNRMVGAKE